MINNAGAVGFEKLTDAMLAGSGLKDRKVLWPFISEK
jgi:hypothetical protein